MRQFDTGAVRDTEDGKLDYEAALSPQVLQAFVEYMHRASKGRWVVDNWQKGIPRDVYAKSLIRHVMEFWALHRVTNKDDEEYVAQRDALCAVLFNAMGYLYEDLNGR